MKRLPAPEGCILNAPRPAAVNIRHVTGQMLPDVVLGCLGQTQPGIAHAEGAPFAIFALFDRIEHPARGRDGGGDGAPGRIYLAGGGALKGKGKQIVPAGDAVVLELPGGGGLGRAG